ncbi:MAG: hypothetical protein K2K57_06695 [Oscillospiraceae bacterium]|nr:hypothetical protein [Oscillospiraceae bacterium]
MSNKQINEKYIEALEKSCPDMDKLWEKISERESNEPESSDISPFTAAMAECAAPKKHPLRAAACIAALFIAAIGLRGIQTNDSTQLENSSKSDYYENALDERDAGLAAEQEAEENYFENSDAEDGIPEQIESTVTAVSSWNYSTHCEYADSYEVLQFAPTDSPLATGTPYDVDEEYFVEENVLAETDYFLDCRIISAEEIDSAMRYVVEVIHFISDDISETDRTAEIISRSPYALRTGREYLLPISESEGERTVAFGNAPQIEFTADRQIVCHNGWEFARDGASIDYPQVYPDDFFFDRMNITAESSLDDLFEKWRRVTG